MAASPIHSGNVYVATGNGAWLRPFRDLVYAMPPYVATDADLAVITRAMLAVAAKA